MAGNVFTASMLDSIIAQAYYNPHLISLLKILLWTGHDEKDIQKMDLPLPIQNTVDVVQEPIPQEFSGKTYRELMIYFIVERQAIMLALYRTTVPNNNVPGDPFESGFRRVIIAPPPGLPVVLDDRVFLLMTST
jgi:hypothetical protein